MKKKNQEFFVSPTYASADILCLSISQLTKQLARHLRKIRCIAMQRQYRTQSNGFFFFHIVVKDGLNSPQCRSAASFPAGHAMPRLHRASPAPHPAGWRRKLSFLLSGSRRRPADPPEAQGRSVMPSAGARPVRRIGIKSRGRLSGLRQHRTMGTAGFGGSFAPIVQYKKWEIHPVFPHF